MSEPTREPISAPHPPDATTPPATDGSETRARPAPGPDDEQRAESPDQDLPRADSPHAEPPAAALPRGAAPHTGAPRDAPPPGEPPIPAPRTAEPLTDARAVTGPPNPGPPAAQPPPDTPAAAEPPNPGSTPAEPPIPGRLAAPPPIPGPRAAEPPTAEQPAAEPRVARPRPLGSRLVLAAAALLLSGAAVYHLGTIFLTIAPPTPVARQYQNAVAAHVYPEFEQNWQLFAPNPLQQDVAVEARVQTISPDGVRTDSPWVDLTAQDIAHIRGNPAPSHLDQNLLRRAWDFYTAWHNAPDETPIGDRGRLSGDYLERIALQRVGRDWRGQPVVQLQLRAAVTPVTGPAWTGAPQHGGPSYRTLPWWPVADADYQGLGST